MADTYREGFDQKWPGDEKPGVSKDSPVSSQDTADLAGTVQEPGDPMDAHDTFRDLNNALGEPGASTHTSTTHTSTTHTSTGAATHGDSDERPGEKVQHAIDGAITNAAEGVKSAVGVGSDDK